MAALLDAIAARGYAIVLVSTAEGSAPLAWPGERPDGLTVLRRPNAGYDFGSWATGLDRYPQLASADQVLLVNDSLAGPFAPIGHLLDGFDATAADVWGLTDTTQFGHHLQSYFVGYKNAVLCEPPLRRFWREIRVEGSRDDVIWACEIGLSRLLHREGFTLDAAIHYSRVVRDGENPTIIGWRALLDAGFPFVKRQLLHSPEVAPDGDRVPAELKSRYGVDVGEWI